MEKFSIGTFRPGRPPYPPSGDDDQQQNVVGAELQCWVQGSSKWLDLIQISGSPHPLSFNTSTVSEYTRASDLV